MYWLAEKGANTFVPVGHSPDVDLVALVGSRTIRIQVKTSTQRRNGRYPVMICTRGGNQSWNGVTKYFDPNRFDFLFVHVAEGRRWFIPSTEIDSRSAIHLGGPKYSEFEIESGPPIPVHSDPIEAPLDLPTRCRGSADVGESGGPVKSVLLAEWVRLPPPPSKRRFVGRFERTTISTAHQVTIPRDAFVPAGFEVGDKLHATCTGPGRVVLERIDKQHGSLTLPDDIA